MPGKETLFNTPINKPYLSTSLQVSPAIQNYRPVTGELIDPNQWYSHGIHYGNGNGNQTNTSLNIFFYGMHLDGVYSSRSYFADAISANTNLDNDYFNSFHDYRIEWETGEHGYIKWYIDEKFIYSIEANALNITGAIIPEEPM